MITDKLYIIQSRFFSKRLVPKWSIFLEIKHIIEKDREKREREGKSEGFVEFKTEKTERKRNCGFWTEIKLGSKDFLVT